MTNTLTTSEQREFDTIQEQIKTKWVLVAGPLDEIATLAKIVRTKRLWRGKFASYDEYAKATFGRTGKAMDALVWREEKKAAAKLNPPVEGSTRNPSTSNLEYVGTESDKENKPMPARRLPGAEIEHVTPPPLPVPAAAMKPVQVPISIATHLDAIIREAKKLAESGPAEFKLGAFGHLIGELQKLRNGMQMHFTSILDQVPAVKPRSRATSEELQAYCQSIGLPAEDGEWFFDKMLQSGWKVDGRQIADCYATIRNWKRIGCMASQKKHQQFNGRPVAPVKNHVTKELDAELARARKGIF